MLLFIYLVIGIGFGFAFVIGLGLGLEIEQGLVFGLAFAVVLVFWLVFFLDFPRFCFKSFILILGKPKKTKPERSENLGKGIQKNCRQRFYQ